MVDPLQLTPEMIAAIEHVARKADVRPETVLRRAIFSYAEKFASSAPPDDANVVWLAGKDGGAG